MRAGIILAFSVLISTTAFSQQQKDWPQLPCDKRSVHAIESGPDTKVEPAKPQDVEVCELLLVSTPPQHTLDPSMSRANASSEPIEAPQSAPPTDLNRSVYYRNKLEFSLDAGYLPINIPFPLDIFVGDNYNTYPLQYTLVPIIGSLRWHIDGVGGPWIFRGNFDLTLSGSVTAIPRGPETRYFSYDMGIRRNFVPRKSKIAPYFDVRLGVGNIDAKGPQGVPYAQGEDLTFTVNMGSGVRYNFSSRYALSAGLNFMHISNLDLSEGNGKPSWGVRNYGINVYGPMIGLDIQLRRHHQQPE